VGSFRVASFDIGFVGERRARPVLESVPARFGALQLANTGWVAELKIKMSPTQDLIRVEIF
jgi:hypothetical protein